MGPKFSCRDAVRRHKESSTRNVCILIVCVFGDATLSPPPISAFSVVSGGRSRPCRPCAVSMAALTERQMQFWEDVEDGLDQMEEYYRSERGLDMDRVRAFGRSARGEDPPPPMDPATGHQPSEEHVVGLTARPFWNAVQETTLFPWAAALQDEAPTIRQEFQSKSSALFEGDSSWQTQVMGTGWSAIRLQRLGRWNVENCQQFPLTYKILQRLQIPLAVRGVCFARQLPQTGVAPHSDGRNFILTAHLGLQVPEGCWIQVGSDQDPSCRQSWKVDELLTLDTSFVHSTHNPSDSEDRNVLIIDFWHPELTEAERAGLEWVYNLRNQYESGLIPIRPLRGNYAFSAASAAQQKREQGGLGATVWNAFMGRGRRQDEGKK